MTANLQNATHEELVQMTCVKDPVVSLLYCFDCERLCVSACVHTQDSGGGNIYDAGALNPGYFYKALKDQNALHNLEMLNGKLSVHPYTGWAAPVQLVHSQAGHLTGYLMRVATGQSLHEWEAQASNARPCVWRFWAGRRITCNVLGSLEPHLSSSTRAMSWCTSRARSWR